MILEHILGAVLLLNIVVFLYALVKSRRNRK